jgi:hypothetical protein
MVTNVTAPALLETSGGSGSIGPLIFLEKAQVFLFWQLAFTLVDLIHGFKSTRAPFVYASKPFQ